MERIKVPFVFYIYQRLPLLSCPNIPIERYFLFYFDINVERTHLQYESLTVQVQKLEYSRQSETVPWLLLASPG